MELLAVKVWVVWSVDQDVVHVNGEPVLSQLLLEDRIHHCLEGGRKVGETEEHDARLEQSFVGDECRFPLVAFFYANIVVSPSNVEFGEQARSLYFINQFRD